jgi:hemolysin III
MGCERLSLSSANYWPKTRSELFALATNHLCATQARRLLMEQVAQLRQEFPAWRRSSEEELVNAVTHGLGFVIAVAGSLVMMSAVLVSGNTRLIVGCGLYLTSLLAVYAASTLSHSPTSFRWKLLFRQFDQAFIYLLIVGTYTPYALEFLHGWQWDVLTATMWAVAIMGFIAKVFFAHEVHSVPVKSYLVLGWMPIVAIPAIWQVAPAATFDAIIAGGLCYMAGTFFLLRDDRVRHFHAIWHLCVIGGSACHFFGILVFVMHGAS